MLIDIEPLEITISAKSLVTRKYLTISISFYLMITRHFLIFYAHIDWFYRLALFFFCMIKQIEQNKRSDRQFDDWHVNRFSNSFIHSSIYLFLTLSIIIFSYLHDCYLCCFVSTTNITTKNINNNNNNNKI